MFLIKSKQYSQTYLLKKIKVDIIIARKICVKVKYFFNKNHKTMYIEFYYLRKVEMNRSTQKFENSNQN